MDNTRKKNQPIVTPHKTNPPPPKMKFSLTASLLMLSSSAVAFSPVASNNRIIASQSTQLFNVPPPGTDADEATIKDAADREAPPQSFFQLQANCARAAELAIRDGHKLLEVEVCSEYLLYSFSVPFHNK